jgi:hypothetical protein
MSGGGVAEGLDPKGSQVEEHKVDNLENSGTFIANFLSSIGFGYSYSAGLNRAEGC